MPLSRIFRRQPGFPIPSHPDRERFAEDMAQLPAQHGYVIHFTPRSGSSWLTDIAARTCLLGVPGESFNPNFMPRMAAAFNAQTLEEYCAILPRRRKRGNVWGFEITYHQLRAVFGSDRAFLGRFGQLPAFWLVREDIVAQGISLAKMQATKLAHSPEADETRLESAERLFPYDAEQIRYWISHIRAAEDGTEALLAGASITPFRMTYEQNTHYPPSYLAKVIGREIGLPQMRLKDAALTSPHRQLATAQNRDYAARFRDENADWLAEIEAARSQILAQVTNYAPRRGPGRDQAPDRSDV